MCSRRHFPRPGLFESGYQWKYPTSVCNLRQGLLNMIRVLTFITVCVISLTWSANVAICQDISGPWSGQWHSEANDHRGKIEATFCQVSPDSMQAKFRGTFAKVIPFRYATRLNIVSQQPGLTVLAGNRRLPLGGQFNYHITMTDDCFNGSFSSRRNRGTFVMQRQ